MARALVGFGANLGSPQELYQEVQRALKDHAAIESVSGSRLYFSKPAGGPTDQPVYTNGSFLLDTSLPPLALLDFLQHLEQEAGRQRIVRWGARTLDLDLLYYDSCIIESERLLVPHPRAHLRRFVAEPCAEIARHWKHPLLQMTLGEQLALMKAEPVPLLLIGGTNGMESEIESSFRQEACRTVHVHCSPITTCLELAQMAGQTIAIRIDEENVPSEFRKTGDRFWTVLARKPGRQQSRNPKSVTSPVIDCCGKDVLGEIQVFAQSLSAPHPKT